VCGVYSEMYDDDDENGGMSKIVESVGSSAVSGNAREETRVNSRHADEEEEEEVDGCTNDGVVVVVD
jgi:hypothetical protein